MKIIKIHNVEIDQVTERPMTDDELAQLELDKESVELEAAELTKAKAAKTALLEKLGITEEEAKLLLS